MAARTEANLALTADNKTDAAFRQVNTSLKNTARTLQIVQGPLGPIAGRFTALASAMGTVSVKGIAFTGAIVGASVAIQKGLREFAKTESQLMQLEAQLVATGYSAGKTSDELETLAQNVAASTLASLEEVRTAEGILLSFRSITEDSFDRALKASQDLAAAGFGSITDGAKQVGKALEDPITGLASLRRAGVTFSQSQKDVIASLVETGNSAQAMSLILEGIESQVGGAGTGAAGGLAGKFDTLTQSVKNFWDALGQTANTGPFGDAIINIATSLDWLSDKVETFENRVNGMDLREAVAALAQLDRDIKNALGGEEPGWLGNLFNQPNVVDGDEVELLKVRKAAIESRIVALQKENELADRRGQIAQEEIARQQEIARAKALQDEMDKARLKRDQEIAKWHKEIYANFVKEQKALDEISSRLDPIGALTQQYLADREKILAVTGQEATKQVYLNALAEEYKENLQAAKEAMEELSEAEQEVYDNAEAIGNILADGFKAATLEGEKFADVMNDVLGRVASKLLDILIIENLVQGFAGAVTGIFSSSSGGGGGAAPIVDRGTSFIPQADIGGPVEGPTLVGEAGPEILYPPKHMKLDPIIVGENGPEVIDFPKGSFLKSNRDLQAMAPQQEKVETSKSAEILPFIAPPATVADPGGPADILPFPGPYKQEKSDEEKIAAITGKSVPKRSDPPEIGGRPFVGKADTGGYRSGPTMVGESGPEIVDLPENSYVTANRDIQQVSPEVTVNVINNGPPVEVEVHKENRGDGNQLISVVLNKVAESVSNNGIVGRSIQQTFGTRQRVITR